MSYLEILLLSLGAILPFYTSINKTNKNTNIPLFLILGLLVSHGLIDGFRWQMSPIYFINMILVGCLLLKFKYFKGNWFRRIMSGTFLVLMLGIGFLLSTILPVFELPIPTGNYQVGSKNLHIVTEEEEYITADVGDRRELSIKVWYPAIVRGGKTEDYLNDGDRKGFANKYGLPENTFNYLDKVETHTYEDATVAQGKFPILIFSHGYYSQANGYYALIEEIVSRGYIVMNINHTYESVGSLFPSGEVKLYALDYDREHNNQAMADMIWKSMERFKKATNEEEKRKAIEETTKKYFAAEITKRWAKDIDKLVKELPKWEASSFLSNHMDTSKIGVFGHSQGGAAAGQSLLDNPKIKAGINIDGVQWGEMIDTFISKPFLYLSSDWPEEHPDFNEYIYKKESSSDFYKAKIKQSGHSNFMDIPLMVNLSLINEAGKIEPQKATQLSAELVIAFFEKYLKMKNLDLLNMSKQFPELEIEKMN